jgi:hypothetical protein
MYYGDEVGMHDMPSRPINCKTRKKERTAGLF